jgi:hypothetical protein
MILGGICLISFAVPFSFSAEPIKVGIVLPLTGEKAAFGEIEKNSFIMALNEINKAGGVKGSKIELLRMIRENPMLPVVQLKNSFPRTMWLCWVVGTVAPKPMPLQE